MWHTFSLPSWSAILQYTAASMRGALFLVTKKSLKIASGNPEMRHRTQACTKTAFKVEIDQSASRKGAGYFSDCDNRASVEHN